MLNNLLAALLIFSFTITATAQREAAGGATQAAGRVRALEGSWKGPDLKLIRTLLTPRRAQLAGVAQRHTPPASKPRAVKVPVAAVSTVKFVPRGDSGVAILLAAAFGRNAAEVTALKEAFDQIKLAYESEVGKEGKSNNLAAAMTFFLATNVMAYNGTPEPTDEATDEIFNTLEQLMGASPELAQATNAQKHFMHDWLVYMAGFTLGTYLEAKKNGDAEGLKTSRELADVSTQIILGTGLGSLGSAPRAPMDMTTVLTTSSRSSFQPAGLRNFRPI